MKRIPKVKVKTITVVWMDSGYLDGWKSRDHSEDIGISMAISRGILLSESDDRFNICHSVDYNQDHQALGILAIPKAAIIRYKIKTELI